MAYFGEILAGARCALEPIDSAFVNENALKEFLAEFGWDVNASPGAVGTIKAAFAIGPAFEAALAVAQQLESGSATPDPALVSSLSQAFSALVGAFQALEANPPTGGMPAPLNQPGFWQEVGPALADSLVLRHVKTQQPVVYAILRLSGLAEVTRVT